MRFILNILIKQLEEVFKKIHSKRNNENTYIRIYIYSLSALIYLIICYIFSYRRRKKLFKNQFLIIK